MEVLFGVLLAIAVLVVVLAAKRGAEAAQRDRQASLREVPARPMSAAGSVGARSPAGSVFSAPAPARDRRLGPASTGAAVTPRSGEPNGPPARPWRAGATGDASVTADGTPSHASTSIRESTREAPRRARTEADSWWDTSARPANRAPARPAVRRELPPIDLNAASVDELQGLPGVGVRAADRIVEHRERHGRFDSVDDLGAVEGFDPHRVARLAPRAIV